MNDDFDRKLKDLLEDGNEQQLYDEEGIFPKIKGSFRGPMRGWVIYLFVINSLFTLLFFYSVWQAVATRVFQAHLMWVLAALFCVVITGLGKIWYWGELNKNTLLREMKRMELRLAQIADKLE